MNTHLFFTVLFQELRKKSFLAEMFGVGFLYSVVTVSLINIGFFSEIFLNSYPLWAKPHMYAVLALGSFSALSSFDLFALGIASILFGMNAGLIIEKMEVLKKRGHLQLVFGGGIISLVATGCTSCGLSVLSLMGLGGTIAILPLRGRELSVLAIFILLLSLVYNIGTIIETCNISVSQTKKKTEPLPYLLADAPRQK